uniref:Knottin scorpion toxin-like domain-containing protein n=1 Tax=Setaria viridis TaxID=4556 RepID=A0A4U6WRX4_SETVI|nr:hypothetical protein SEVIR_1G344400v2 [Setaria viridis]
MRISPLLLAAIALLLVSSGTTVKVSVGCTQPQSVILYPGKPCNPQVCKTNCAEQYNDGIGTCMKPDGCDCEYCQGRDIPTPLTRNWTE